MSHTEALRIAMIAPPWFEIPPQAYGGIEAMCADLVDALINRGHQVTLIAAGRAGTRARFRRTYAIPPSERIGQVLPEVLHAAAAARILDELDLDVIHDHTLAGLLRADRRSAPTVATVHGPADGELAELYRHLSGPVHLVALSQAQRAAAPDLPWVGVVPNAVRVADFPFTPIKRDYVAFLGRVCPDKGLDLAIAAARTAGLPLVGAGKCQEAAERAYFAEYIRPLLGPDVTWLGEIDTPAKHDLLAHARCLLFPICWEEPFGMVMIEALACGTPVVALRHGAVPEVLRHGVTGYICDDPDQLSAGITAACRLSPDECRTEAHRRFDAPVMAAGYEQAYRRVIQNHASPDGQMRTRPPVMPATIASDVDRKTAS